MIKLLVIAPYKGMCEIVDEILSSFDDVTADVYSANLSEAQALLSTINAYDYDAILSRGGTALLIEQMVKMPVFDIGISSLDALRAITLAQNFSQPMAIMGYENITNTMHVLCEVLNWTYPILTISDETEALAEMQKLKDNGISVIVCDVLSAKTAQSIGLNPVLISSGYETIELALSQAIRLSQGYNHNREELSHLTISFQNNPYSCTIINSLNKIVLSTLDISNPDNILDYIKDHLEDLSKEDAPEFERSFKNGILSFCQMKRYLNNEQYWYLYARFHERHDYRKIDAIQVISSNDLEKLNYSFLTASNYQTTTQDQLEKYGRSLSPVIIMGEPGTGKDNAAYIIHSKSPYQSSVYYLIDCKAVNDKTWNYLFTHHDSPLSHNKHSIYFKHMDTLPYTIFMKLISYISDTGLAKRNRLIFSFVSKTKNDHAKEYMQVLTQNINCLLLKIPALRERPDDIPYLCTYYINQNNPKLGKQIIGFDNRAMKAMSTFMWENNLSQFRRIIEELMLVTSTSYISYENTMRLLSQESALWTNENSIGLQFNLNQPLADINYDIVRHVMKEENDNHSKTAERLGISRSTLWRMLRNEK